MPSDYWDAVLRVPRERPRRLVVFLICLVLTTAYLVHAYRQGEQERRMRRAAEAEQRAARLQRVLREEPVLQEEAESESPGQER